MSEDQDEPQDVPSAYTREDLVHLDTIDAIRMRPRMYLGHDDQRALLNFLMCGATPGLENAIHRFASYVTVTAKVDGEFTVFDNGPGYGTVSVHEDDQTGTEMLLTRSIMHIRPTWKLMIRHK